jgi:small-conductance mechanosensitive channel
MAENVLAGMIQLWVDLGLYDVILPFLFVFTIVYATLDRTRILGGYKNINALMGFCIGFIAAASVSTVDSIHMFFSATGFLMVAGLSIMILASMFGITSIVGKDGKWYDKMPRIVITVIMAAAIFYMLSIAFGFERWLIALIPNISTGIVQSVVVGAFFVLIMWYIVRGTGSSSSSGASSSSSSNSKTESPTEKASDKSATDGTQEFPEPIGRKIDTYTPEKGKRKQY